MRKGVFVTGIGTEIGKTVASAILTEALEADYWKPVQSGDLDYTDTMKVRRWISNAKTKFHPETHRLHTPMSPHAAAEIDGVQITLDRFHLPETDNFLLAEGAGGLMVPLNDRDCIIDLIGHLGLPVVLVSRHYLGSINHTLLSIEALQRRNIPIAALIFNGKEHPTTESVIQRMSGVEALARIEEIEQVDKDSIQKEATRLRDQLSKLL